MVDVGEKHAHKFSTCSSHTSSLYKEIIPCLWLLGRIALLKNILATCTNSFKSSVFNLRILHIMVYFVCNLLYDHVSFITMHMLKPAISFKRVEAT